MNSKQTGLSADIIAECQDKYSAGSRIPVGECLSLFERNKDYIELVYAINAMANRTGYTEIWTPLKYGKDYINQNFNEPEPEGWKNIPLDEYLATIKRLSERRLTDTKEIGQFIGNCLCAAWIAKHSSTDRQERF